MFLQSSWAVSPSLWDEGRGALVCSARLCGRGLLTHWKLGRSPGHAAAQALITPPPVRPAEQGLGGGGCWFLTGFMCVARAVPLLGLPETLQNPGSVPCPLPGLHPETGVRVSSSRGLLASSRGAAVTGPPGSGLAAGDRLLPRVLPPVFARVCPPVSSDQLPQNCPCWSHSWSPGPSQSSPENGGFSGSGVSSEAGTFPPGSAGERAVSPAHTMSPRLGLRSGVPRAESVNEAVMAISDCGLHCEP